MFEKIYKVSKMPKEVIYKKAIDTYGEENQLNMLIEEMAELIQAINKYRRSDNYLELEHVAEETADVKIMLEQLDVMFEKYNFTGCENRWKSEKLARLEKRLRESE